MAKEQTIEIKDLDPEGKLPQVSISGVTTPALSVDDFSKNQVPAGDRKTTRRMGLVIICIMASNVVQVELTTPFCL